MPTKPHPLADCNNCPLFGQKFAESDVPKCKPKAAVVSRSPGYHDVMANRPFSGPSGKVLDFLLQQNGVKREEVLVTNTVLCDAKGGKVPPAAIKACAPRLGKELEGIDLVIAAGSEAVNSLVGRGSVERYRGYRITDEQAHRTYVATNNPALVLRDDSSFPNLVKDFKRAFHPIPEPTLPKVEVIENANDARAYLKAIEQEPTVAADLETRGGLSKRARFISVQFSTRGDTAYVLGEREALWDDHDFLNNHLLPFFENRERHFIWHNGQFDVKVLQHSYGIDARIDQDTILLSYALDERPGTHSLEYLLMESFGWPHYEDDEIAKIKKTGVVTDYDKFYTYAGYDVAGTFQLYEHFKPLAEQEEVW